MVVQSVSSLCGKKVFTNKGALYGEAEDVILSPEEYRIAGIKVMSTPGSLLAKTLGGAKRGVILPYSLIVSIEDVIIVKHVIHEEKEEVAEEEKTE